MSISILMLVAPALAGDPAVAENKFKLPAPEPYALLQVWATAYDMDEDPQADPASYGDPEDDMGFKVRRARVGFEGDNDRLRYGVVVGTSAPFDAVSAQGSSSAGGAVSVVDAYGGYSPMKGAWVNAGLFRVPVGREHLISAAELTFEEHSVATEWMTPGRDAGLVLDGSFGPGRVRIGAFNGNGSIISDDNSGKLLCARVEASVGPGGTYRTFGTVDNFTLGVGVDGFLDDDVATRTMNAGADVIVRTGGLALLAEGRFASVTPTSTDIAEPEVWEPTKRLGVTAQLGYTMKHWEPAARFSMFDDDMSVDDNGDVANVTAGVTWHGLDDAVRMGGGYVLRLEQGGQSMRNDSARLWMQIAL